MEPDFESLASAWISGDLRSRGADDETQKRIATRIAAALAERRRQVAAGPSQDNSLIVTIPSDRLTENGLDEDALAQLETFIVEHQQMLDDEEKPPAE